MFICMAALFYIAKYALLEIRYSNSLGSERTIEELEQLIPGGTWISIFFLIIGLAYLLWDDREVIRKNLFTPDRQVEETKKTDNK
ncbi:MULTISPECIES: hypothetical protein [Bacillus]|uniref:hypothetical protein n=1 Tax=Bacillus TaxID=1386 RepID=UPI001F55206D|nr:MULTISPECIES: hypothetical protein [Bacillus]